MLLKTSNMLMVDDATARLLGCLKLSAGPSTGWIPYGVRFILRSRDIVDSLQACSQAC